MSFQYLTEKRDYIIRQATLKDLKSLSKLETLCWKKKLQTSESKIKARIKNYPEGQFILEKKRKIVGVIYSQRIENAKLLEGKTASTVHSLHKKSGKIVQLLAINIHPQVQNLSLGDQLLEFVLQNCTSIRGVESVVGVTLCKDYDSSSSLSFSEYIHKKNERGKAQDAILYFHQSHGATIEKELEGYRPADIANEGYGVLISYKIDQRVPRLEKDPPFSSLPKPQEDVGQFLQKTIEIALGKKKRVFKMDHPLMEMGLDSTNLLQLQDSILDSYGVFLEPTFFFEYNTPQKIREHLKEILRLSEEKSTPACKAKRKSTLDKSPRPKPNTSTSKDIAIVGISCKLPGGIETPEELWEVLAKGESLVGELPQERFTWPTEIDPETTHPGINRGGFIKDIACFDASFFRISPKEAQCIDPQQRILLELAWSCLEQARVLPKELKDKNVGVFVGASGSDYARLLQEAGIEVEAHQATGNSLAVLANRISYFFDFSGPSLQMDTACSSSLVAVHSAVRSLQQNECSQALVGGVNLICHPANSIAYYKAGMLAQDGKCKTFDSRANGYVRSEGAVVMLLKPLEKAIQEEDFIYAVIKGSATNHGGLSGGLTVPNPQKQAELLKSAWKNAGVTPEQLSYIEAHGTGTSLGDPIEIKGMQKAFASFFPKESSHSPWCALASLKSNLGHLEAAAGIAGVLKAILCMQKKQLPPTIHFKKLNPKIRLGKSPFYIVKKVQKWDMPKNQLRYAGVSSFGSGGSNAHIVLGEYVSPKKGKIKPRVLVPLYSFAKKKHWIAEVKPEPSSLPKDYKKILHPLLQENIAEQKKFLNVLDFWGKGVVLNRDKLSRGIQPRRISLPTYPFAQKKSWISEYKPPFFPKNRLVLERFHPMLHKTTLALSFLSEPLSSGKGIKCMSLPGYPFAKKKYGVTGSKTKPNISAVGNRKILHPLLHENTSNLFEQSFSSTFTGKEFFLRDHKVNGKKILPAVAYLEMAQAAVEKALGGEEERGSLQFKNVVWTEPLFVNDSPKDVHIRLVGEEEEEISYEIYTKKREGTSLHSQGVAQFKQREELSVLDIFALKEQMRRGVLKGESCYQAFPRIGLDYGLTHQGIVEVYQGRNQVLAKLFLPFTIEDTENDYVLHPSLLDSALQSSIGLSLNLPSLDSNLISLKPSLPFALESVEILKTCTKKMYAWVRYSSGTHVDKVQKLDMDLCDELGNICVKIKGISFRRLEEPESFPKEAEQNITLEENEVGLQPLVPLWDPITPKLMSKITASSNHSVWIVPEKEGALEAFRKIKALLNSGYGNKDIEWTIITKKSQLVKKEDSVLSNHAGIFGLLGSLAKEYPSWKIRLLDVDSLESVSQEEYLSLPWEEFAYRDKQWFQQKLLPLKSLDRKYSLYRKEGVYVVIGGAGGIGKVWSDFLVKHYKARIIWIGRREKVDTSYHYISADASQLDSLKEAFAEIKQLYSKIHGVIHSAIVLKDQSLAKMEESTFLASFSAKVDTSINIDKVFGKEDLDFMLFFSSMLSFDKSPGQSNYAAGCTFKDSFAQMLNQKHSYPVKIINWGYWGSVGIVTNASYNKQMKKVGIGSIEPAEAMEFLETFVNSSLHQVALIKTLQPEVMEALCPKEEAAFYPKILEPALPQKNILTKNTLPSFSSKEQEMSFLLAEILAASLSSLGLFTQGISKIKDLSLEKPSALFWERWLNTSVDYLQKEKLLSKELTFSKEVRELPVLWKEWEEKKSLWRKDPHFLRNQGAQCILLETCLKALPEILKGKQLVTDVIFPRSSFELVEGIYKGNILADYFNEVLNNTLLDSIRQTLEVDRKRIFSILEIGAGTGATTENLLPKLQEFSSSIEEYCYTDISYSFLMHAKEHYQSDFPALRTRIFDVSRPLRGQSIAKNNYDFVIATNVLHATPNIRETLRNTKATLKNGGLLLLNEISVWSLFSHLTFGLLEGWWLYEDDALRLGGSPGLSPKIWKRILEEEGFESIFFPAEENHKLGQQIIAASSDGFVRQRRAMSFPKNLLRSSSPLEVEPPQIKTFSSPMEKTLREKSISYFQRLVGQTLKMNPEKIDPSKPLEKYGIDSILVIQLTDHFRKVFPDITSTLFFEVQNLEGLVDYFLENKKEELLTLLSRDTTDFPQQSPPVFSGALPIEKSMAKRIFRISRRPSFSQTTKLKRKNSEEDKTKDVAVIGMSGRYPKSKNLQEFWENLANGVNCITEIPPDRWNWLEHYSPEKGVPGKIYTKWGGFLEDIDKFDPLFFKISPREAERMDPQERLFLEISYQALEDAAYTPESLGKTRRIGVFVGVMNCRYLPQPAYFSIANRLSYIFNFQGPSMAVDTACSSSLTAIHLALESIYKGSSECAIAGGVNLIIDPVHYLGLTEMRMLSASNECKSFGEKADGFIDAEGVGAILLKPLKQAEEDGDHIYGVIKGSSVNAGGKTNGYTVPNPKAQSLLVADALEQAKVSPEKITYIEAHGTGTVLGDPIEVAGLTRVFRERTEKRQFCAIGSVKSNIGHCESAAGIAAVTKVLLQLQHQKLAPSLHSKVANPEIDFEKSPFVVNQELKSWDRLVIDGQEIPRIAGISSFGAGGSNAHLIVAEYFSSESTKNQIEVSSNNLAIVVLSAKSEEQLQKQVQQLLTIIQNKEITDKDLTNVAFTLQVGREAMEQRLAILVHSMAELEKKLSRFLAEEKDQENTYCGQTSSHEDIVGLFANDVEIAAKAQTWVESKQYAKFLKLWVNGFPFNWNNLYQETKPRRISLPTYPFAKKKYWISSNQRKEEFFLDKKIERSPGKSQQSIYDGPAKDYRGNEVTCQINEIGIALIRLQDKKHKNQLSEQTMQGIVSCFREAVSHPRVKAVILTGYGNVFCMGGNRESLEKIASGAIKFSDIPLYRYLLECPLPVISAMQGHALGAGFAFGLYGDLIVLSKEHIYSANFMRYGIPPGMGATLIVEEKLGKSLAAEMLWTATEFTGEELEKRRASVIVKPSEDVLEEAFRLARSLCQKNLSALQAFKRGSVASILEKIPAAITRELKMHKEAFQQKEAQEQIEEHFNKVEKIFNPGIALKKLSRETKSDEVSQISQSLQEVVDIVKGIVGQILQILPLELSSKDNFSDLGTDSISGIEVIQKINRYFDLPLEAAVLYDHPTIERLSQHVHEQIPKQKHLPQEPLQSQESSPGTKRKTVVLSPLSFPQSNWQKDRQKDWQKEKKEVKAKKPPQTTLSDISVKKTATFDTKVAIIGMSGRFPGAENIDVFWNNLCEGRNSIREIPPSRWASNYYSPEKAPGKSYSKWCGLLEDIDKFDPLFFNISPREAEQMDPQQRLFLQESWRAIEDAGYNPESLSGSKCGVFVGNSGGDYGDLSSTDTFLLTSHYFTGMSASILAGRISYFLDLRGPSLTIDTACSSSLVALHHAYQSLLQGETDLAIAGGVSLLTTPKLHILCSQAGMLSPQGHCYTFDQRANGFVPGEGVGVVVLKPFLKAREDNDRIYGVIKGSGINQDGTTVGITAPSAKSQTQLQKEVYRRYNIDPNDIGYMEAHGTGTELGDPIEVKALKQTFSQASSAKKCALGAVKTNVGHTLAAAGIISLIKTVLSLYHKKLVPSLHYKNINKNIDLKGTPFYVNTELKDWQESSGKPRLAAINSFGYSGTNSHVVIEENPSSNIQFSLQEDDNLCLILLSAKNKERLQNHAQNLLLAMAKHQRLSTNLADIAYTLQVGRQAMDKRLAIVVSSFPELEKKLRHFVEGTKDIKDIEGLYTGEAPFEKKSLALFHTEEEQEEVIKKWLQSKKLGKLAQVWTQGLAVGWNKLYLNLPRRVSLPTYPFAKEHYWKAEGKADSNLVAYPSEKRVPASSFFKEATECQERIEYDIVSLLSKALKIKEVELDLDENMADYGFDSFIMTNFVLQLNQKYDIEMQPAAFFSHTTIRSLAAYLLQQYPEEMHRSYPDAKLKQSSFLRKTPRILPAPTPVTHHHSRPNDIAIIGMEGIFPGSKNLQEFWQQLVTCQDLVTEVPLERWSGQSVQRGIKWGAFINDVDKFDAPFFKLSPREVEYMDPQHRLFLQTVWKTIENAGYKASHLSGKSVGVFVGAQFRDYELLLRDSKQLKAQMATGNDHVMLANRISYLLNFRGPSEVIETACSSSLVAVHRAITSLQRGESEIAIAGGVSLMLSPDSFLLVDQLGILSPDGKCKTFDQRANGYVRGEGVAAIALKDLAQAEKDGDYIYAIIKGSAVNHGGKSSSLTAPNPDAQADLLVKAYQTAGVPCQTVSYIEAHGTGTELGDPVEVEALKSAFSQLISSEESKRKPHYCGLGTIKHNMGHLEPAAGITGVIKTVLALQHQKLPGLVHLESLNPYIELEDTPFYLVEKTKDWEKLKDDKGDDIPRRAGVSSFGYGGTNAHVVLEEYSRDFSEKKIVQKQEQVIILSAKTEPRLREYAKEVLNYLQESPASLTDIAYTLQIGREEMPERIATVVSSLSSLTKKLQEYLAKKKQIPKFYHGKTGKVEQVFSIDGPEGQEYFRLLLANKNLEKLAQLWVLGTEVDWSLLHSETDSRRVPLPSYPFEKKRYWIDSLPQEEKITLSKKPESEKRGEKIYYKNVWQNEKITQRQECLSGTFLIFDRNEKLVETLKRNQVTKKCRIILVQSGKKYQETREDVYQINPNQEADYLRLFKTLKTKNLFPSHIIHLWTHNENELSLEDSLEQSIYSIFYMIKAHTKTKTKKGAHFLKRIIFLYRDNPLEQTAVYAAVSGYAKSLAQYYPKLLLSVVKNRETIKNSSATLNIILEELQQLKENFSNQVFYKNQQRYVRKVVSLELKMTKPSLLKKGGVYVITGGAGAIGIIFGRFLAEKYQAKIALIGRSELSKRKNAFFPHIKEWEKSGAEVLYLPANVASSKEMTIALSRIREKFGAIAGIFHVAGVEPKTLVFKKQKEEFSETLSPKVQGTIILDELTQKEPLDFFAMFSSASAILGDFGQCDYAIANHFMDSYIEVREKWREAGHRSGKTLSINWPLWDEGTMGRKEEGIDFYLKSSGMALLDKQTALDAFEEILSNDTSQVIIFKGDIEKIDRFLQVQRLESTFDLDEKEKVSQERQTSIEEELTQIASQLLKVPPQTLDVHENLGEYGFDSLILNEFSAELSKKYQVEILPMIFFAHSSLHSLGKHLLEEYSLQIKPWSAPSALPIDENRNEALDTPNKEGDIAIIGMSGKFPGSKDLGHFWQNLVEQKNLVTEIPKERWDWREKYSEGQGRWGAFLNDVDKFDARFFNISPVEAEYMDPQHRLFLQVAWNTIEDAGYKISDLSGKKVGVFAGIQFRDYEHMIVEQGHNTIHTAMGNDPAMLVNRISYLFDFQGPSEVSETACSSSLVAVNRAIHSLQRGESSLAIAGGVSLILSPTTIVGARQLGILSEDGKCKTFDKDASGYVKGEGVAAVLLKPKFLAEKEGDHIYALIKGSSVNHGGKAHSLTAPNSKAQAKLLATAYRQAKINPETISYIEAHGTGTALGDPIEIEGLKAAFQEFNKGKRLSYNFCGVGSIKHNIGHLEPAAGVAGLIKVALAMQHKKLPGLVHFRQLNSNIRLQETPFYIVEKTQFWEPLENRNGIPIPRRAGVSSFGYGGTNAHIVLEEHQESSLEKQENKECLIVLSAKTNNQLREYAKKLLLHLESNLSHTSLSDLAYTLQEGREEMIERLAIVVPNQEQLTKKLEQFINKDSQIKECYQGKAKNSLEPKSIDISKQNLSEIAQLWVNGTKWDWKSLYLDQKMKRVSLPTYPFASQRFWLSSSDEQNSIITKSQDKRLYYTSHWISKPAKPSLRKSSDNFLVFANDQKVGDILREEFGASNVTLIKAGNTYEQENANTFTIHPQCQEHYQKLGEVLVEKNALPEKIIHLWSHEDFSYEKEKLDRQLHLGIYSLFFLHQQLLKKKITSWEVLYIYSNSSLATQPIYAAVAGFARSLIQEYPQVVLKTIEIDTIAKSSQILPKVIRQEFNQENSDLEIRYRKDKREVRALKKLSRTDFSTDKFFLEKEGVYFITGGAGGLGMIFAQHFAKKAKVVILCGRKPLDEAKKRQLDYLRTWGAEIKYVSLNIANLSEVEGCFNTIQKQYHRLDGVIHCAGVIRDSLLIKKTQEEMEAVLEAKVYGTINLDRATESCPLDFFVTFSSLTSVIGNRGQSDYAYANAFMDHFADYRTKQKGRGKTVSLNWPLWEKGGMKVEAQTLKILTEVIGIKLLSKKTGIDTFEKALSSNYTQLGVLEGEKAGLEELTKSYSRQVDSAPRKLEKTKHNHHNSLCQELKTLISKLLKVDQNELSINDSMGEYGFDSVLFTALANKLSHHFEIKLMPSVFFAHSTIASLSAYLLSEFYSEVTKHYPEVKPLEKKREVPKVVSLEEPLRDKHLINPPNQDIAIIGLGGIFPQSEGLDQFWNNLVKRKNLIREIPPERWDWRDYYGDPTKEKNKTYCKWGGFVHDVDKFDAEFFQVSPMEAELMDPQHRLFLQNVWNTIEDAGYDITKLSGKSVGIFAGMSFHDYECLLADLGDIKAQCATGNDPAMMLNRISYQFNFHGPSEVIQTACSSSLVAIHRAVKSLQAKESEYAIAGGVSLMLSPVHVITLSKMGLLSPEGRCNTFDENANGIVKGEGLASVLLKPLPQAQADKDHIYGVIKGSAVNHGGKASSLTAPNSKAQAQLIIKAYQDAKVHPSTISYIETHGTGTKLGDPVELDGLKEAFSKLAAETKSELENYYCGLGSVKHNIGHLEPAAGIASLVKVLLAMKHKELPGLVHFEKVNPYLGLENTPFYLVQKTQPWKKLVDRKGYPIPRRAGVSSFGYGGVNAHLLIEEVKETEETEEAEESTLIEIKGSHLIVLSAETPPQLKERVRALQSYLEKTPDRPIVHLAYTLQIGRKAMAERLAIIVSNQEELVLQLEHYINNKESKDIFKGTTKQPEQAFQIDDEEGVEYLQAIVKKKKWTKVAQLWTSGVEIDWEKLYSGQKLQRLSLPSYPFAKERYWMTKLESLEEKPQKIISSKLHPLLGQNTSHFREQRFTTRFSGKEFFLKDHVMGNDIVFPGVAYLEMVVAAAQVAANRKVAKVKNVVWAQPIVLNGSGKEVSITLSPDKEEAHYEIWGEEEKERTIYAHGKVAFWDDPTKKESVPPLNISEIKNRCFQKIKVDHFYRFQNQEGTQLGKSLQGIKKIWSNDKEALVALELPKECEEGFNEFILHPSLMLSALQSFEAIFWQEKSGGKLYIPSQLRELEILHPLTPHCYAYATKVDSQKFNVHIINDQGQVMVTLKDYRPFPVSPTDKKNFLSPKESLEFPMTLRGNEFYLRDHVIQNSKVLPGVVYLEMGISSGKKARKDSVLEIQNIVWSHPITIENEPQQISVRLSSNKKNSCLYEVYSPNAKKQISHSQGKLIFKNSLQNKNNGKILDLEKIKKHCRKELGGAEYYSLAREQGFQYKKSFRVIQKLFYNESTALSLMELPKFCYENFHDFVLHPSLMDGALQTIGAIVTHEYGENHPSLPFSLKKLKLINPLTPQCYVYATKKQVHKTKTTTTTFDIQITDKKGSPLILMETFSLRSMQTITPPSTPVFTKKDSEIMSLLEQLEKKELNSDEVIKLLEADEFLP